MQRAFRIAIGVSIIAITVAMAAGCATAPDRLLTPGPAAAPRPAARLDLFRSRDDLGETAAATQPASTTGPASLFLQNEPWQNDQEQKVTFADLPGDVRIVTMFYTTCEGTCLATMENLRRLDASLPTHLRNRVQFVMVTLDPEHDTARALADYRGEFRLPADRWPLLRGSHRATSTLAARLGLSFNARSSRGFSHSTGITLLDAKGNIIQQQRGTLPDLNAAVAAVADECARRTAE